MIAAGDLDKRVTLTRRGSTQDDAGQPVETWATVATVWGSLKHQSGMESIKASAEVSVVRAGIRIRFRTDIDAGMRAAIGGDIYDIEAVLPDYAYGRLDLVCVRVP